MEDITRIRSRLATIRTVEPILEALRTISVGGWQSALRQQQWLREYAARLQGLLTALVPHLSAGRPGRPQPARAAAPRRAALVIGSERGLCGLFNAGLVEAAADYVQAPALVGYPVELWALGSRLARLLRRRTLTPVWVGPLSATSLAPFSVAWDLSRRWLADFEALELEAVDMIYNAYRRPGSYAPTVARLLPPELPPIQERDLWPPPLVDTDPQCIYARVVEQWVALRLYQAIVGSAAAEHSARFQLMESATQNAQRLTTELTQLAQTVRRQAITTELQELAVGAGLIGPHEPGL